jgi:hypothetical protein
MVWSGTLASGVARHIGRGPPDIMHKQTLYALLFGHDLDAFIFSNLRRNP